MASLRQQNSSASNTWVDNLFITFEVPIDSTEQYDIKYLYLFFKKIAENTVGSSGENTISLTFGAYRFNLAWYGRLDEKQESIDIGNSLYNENYPENDLDHEQEYYSNFLILDADITKISRDGLNALAEDEDTITIFRPSNRYNIPNRYKLFTKTGDVIQGYRRMSPHLTYQYYEKDGAIGFKEAISNATEPKAGTLRFIKPNPLKRTRTESQ